MTAFFWPVAYFMALSLGVGLYTFVKVQGSSRRFALCDRSLPFIVVGTTLMAQAVDGNATLGAVSVMYTGSVWAGPMISVGLALSLVIVGRFLASPLNDMNLLTLPDFFARRYGKQTELLVSIVTIVSFIILIAGNLSAVAWVLSVVSGSSYLTALVTATAVILAYTIAGGLYSSVWTDFLQIYIALFGFAAAAVWLIAAHGFGHLVAAAPPTAVDFSGLLSRDSGALVNWAGLVALAIGNTMALDFMERVFAARDGRTARNGCYYSAALTMVIGLCVAVIGLTSLSAVPGLSDPRMVLPHMATQVLPYWIGLLVLIGVIGAAMSTSNGSILVIAVVLTQNVMQSWRATRPPDSTLLLFARLMAVPTAAVAALVAYWRPEPGILLIVAFDIVLAGCVVPLFAGVYWARGNQAGAIAAIVAGSLARVIAYFATPAPWSGLDTLIPPVLSAAAFYSVCRLTDRPRDPGPGRRAAEREYLEPRHG